MVEIIAINEGRLAGDVHYLFNKKVSDRALADEAIMGETKYLKPLAEALAEAVAMEDKCMTMSHKSFNTDEIRALDERRDNIYSAFKMQVRSYMKMPMEAVREAAVVLDQAISTYDIDTAMPLDKETSRLMNLLSDLSEKYSEQVAALNLGLFVSEMTQANQALTEYTDKRTEERMGIRAGAMKEARAAVDAAYRLFVKHVNACALVVDEQAYNDFIAYVNTEIKHYTEHFVKEQ